MILLSGAGPVVRMRFVARCTFNNSITEDSISAMPSKPTCTSSLRIAIPARNCAMDTHKFSSIVAWVPSKEACPATMPRMNFTLSRTLVVSNRMNCGFFLRNMFSPF